MDDGRSDKILDDPKTPAVTKLDNCDIEPVSLLNIRLKINVLKKPLT